MPSGYEKSPDYGDPPRRPYDWLGWVAIALIAAVLWVAYDH